MAAAAANKALTTAGRAVQQSSLEANVRRGYSVPSKDEFKLAEEASRQVSSAFPL